MRFIATDYCYEEYVAIPGDDVEVFLYPEIISPEACQDACRATPSTCLSWIFAQSQYCILKGVDYHETRVAHDTGVTGGPRDCDCSLFP